MKLNKYLVGLLIPAAVTFTACSEYEDTESVSPEAPADAVGAFFAEQETSVVVLPGGKSFDISLARANKSGEVSIPVEVTDAALVGDKSFCSTPGDFKFANEEGTSKQSLTFDKQCVFQTPYSISMKVSGGEKDHPYASGYTSSTVIMSVDYEWESVGKVFADDSYLAPEKVQIAGMVASNYPVDKDNPKKLIQIPNVYGTEKGEAAFSFLIDAKEYKTVSLLNSSDINNVPLPDKYNTGLKKGEEDVWMRAKSISVTTTSETDAEEVTVYTCNFTVTSDLFTVKESTETMVKADNTTKFTFTFTEEKKK